MADYILRGGEVIDGSGRARFRADVMIKGDRIAEIGTVARTAGAHEIDVAGKVVAPGFIDVHTHDDRALFATPEMAAKASQGVTTVVTGNCGISLAPLSIDHAPPPPLDLIGDAADYRYGRFADYLMALDRSPAAINAACLVGHSTLRVGSMSSARPAGRSSRDRAYGRIVAGSARRRRGGHVERPRLCPGRARACGRDRGAGRSAAAGGRALHDAYAQRGRPGARQPRREFCGRPRGRGAGRDLAPQDDRAAEFRPHRPNPAGHRRSPRGAGDRARRLPLHRLLDGADRGAGRAGDKGAGDLVEERAGAGRTRTLRDRCGLGGRPEGGGRPSATGRGDLLDDGRGRCAAGARLPAHDDRLGRAAARFPPAPASVGHLSAGAWPLLPRSRPVRARRGGAAR